MSVAAENYPSKRKHRCGDEGGVQEICSTLGAFAALVDGQVVTWGNHQDGGRCDAVQEDLVEVQEIQAEISMRGYKSLRMYTILYSKCM